MDGKQIVCEALRQHFGPLYSFWPTTEKHEDDDIDIRHACIKIAGINLSEQLELTQVLNKSHYSTTTIGRYNYDDLENLVGHIQRLITFESDYHEAIAMHFVGLNCKLIDLDMLNNMYDYIYDGQEIHVSINRKYAMATSGAYKKRIELESINVTAKAIARAIKQIAKAQNNHC